LQQKFMTILALTLGAAVVAMAQEAPQKHDGTIKGSDEQVAVTGSYAPTPLNETNRAVTEIALDAQAATYRNVASALQTDPSIDLSSRQAGAQSDLSMRGSSFGQTLVLINGLRMNDAQTGHFNLDLPLPMASFDRIEALHGAGSTQYGADALGGAVNLITAAPTATYVRAGAAGGNFGTNQQTAGVGYVSKRYAESLSFEREKSSGFMKDRDYRSLNFGSTTDVTTALGHTVALLGYGDRPYGANQFYGNYASWERTKEWLATIQQPLGARTSVAFGYRRHADDFVLLRVKPAAYENRHLGENFQAALRRREEIGKNYGVYYGVEGYRDRMDSSNLGHHVRDRGAAYVAFDARQWKKFSFNAGAREEMYTAGGHKFAPSAAGGYWINAHAKLKASASSAFRMPTFTDLYYKSPAQMGNVNLKPESAWSYEGGVETNWGAQEASFTVFHRRDTDDIDYVLAPGATVYQAMNFHKLNFTGFEAAWRWRALGHQRIEASYTGIVSSNAPETGYKSKYVYNYPTNNAGLSWIGSTKGGLETRVRIGALQRYKQDVTPLIEATVARPFTLKAGVLRPYVQLTNIANAGYFEVAGVRMPGRAALAGMNFEWKKK